MNRTDREGMTVVAPNPENQQEMSFATFANIHQDIKLLTVAITELRNDMHHPPCDEFKAHIKEDNVEIKDLRKELSEHKRVHEEIGKAKTEERLNHKKFVRNIQTIVIAGLVLGSLTGIAGAVIYAFRNGFEGG